MGTTTPNMRNMTYVIYNLANGKIKYTIKTNKPIESILPIGAGYILVPDGTYIQGQQVNLETLELEPIPPTTNTQVRPPRNTGTTLDTDLWFGNNIETADDMKKLLRLMLKSMAPNRQKRLMNKF